MPWVIAIAMLLKRFGSFVAILETFRGLNLTEFLLPYRLSVRKIKEKFLYGLKFGNVHRNLSNVSCNIRYTWWLEPKPRDRCDIIVNVVEVVFHSMHFFCQ